MTEQHECEMIAAIKKRMEKDYVFDEAGDIVVDWRNDIWWLLNEYETLRKAFTIAIHLLGHGDFKNGNTGPNGLIDEGEVYACRLMDKIKELVPQLYADILEGK